MERLLDDDGCKDRMTTKGIDIEIKKVTNNGMCVFGGCQGKATDWIYNMDCSVDGGAAQLLDGCKKHVNLFKCDDRRKEMFGV